MNINIPETDKKRIVVVGGGFGGIALINRLDPHIFQTVLIDSNNYHQFQPLLYQVATAGLSPDSVSFPLRETFRHKKDFFFRQAQVRAVNPQANSIETSIGSLRYDYLVIAAGGTTNFFGNAQLQSSAFPMKSIEEAIMLKNRILMNLEQAVDCIDTAHLQALMNIVIVGGGATGVELAGAIAEMKNFVIPKDYLELRSASLNIYLVEGIDRLLGGMSQKSSDSARRFLEKMGVNVLLNTKVSDYRDSSVILENGESIPSETIIWVSGVTANVIDGITPEQKGSGGRIAVDRFNRVAGSENIFAIGDICLMTEAKYSAGHPQVALVAIQQGRLLAKNLKLITYGAAPNPFSYKNQGSLATVGRNKAVFDFARVSLSGFFSWIIWMTIHLRSILGTKDKIIVLIEWVWNYFTYNRSMQSIFFYRSNNSR